MPPVDSPTPLPESFIVRIYRRAGRGRGRIAGTVEIVAEGTERSFTGLRELQQILGTGAATPHPARTGRGNPP